MKFKARIISVMMIMMMLISSMSFSSYAAAKKGAVYVDVTQDYGNAQVILALVNQQRAKKHLKKLKLDQSLTNAAVQRAAEISMVIPTSSPHRRPDGRLAKTVNKKAARENCAEGNFQGPAHVVDVWMHSKPHKATIMLKGAKSAGIAYVSNPADRSVGYYVLIVSKKKAKKVERSVAQVPMTKTVVAKSNYLHNNYFFLGGGSQNLVPGSTVSAKAYYAGPKTIPFTAPEINPASFTWTSSNNGVAVVSPAGQVTAVGLGTVTINAVLNSYPSIILSRSYTVTETLPEDPYDPFYDDEYYYYP